MIAEINRIVTIHVVSVQIFVASKISVPMQVLGKLMFRVCNVALWHVDVVVGVAVVWTQDTAVFITAQLNLAWVNLIERGDEALSVDLKDGFVRVNGCCSDLCIRAMWKLSVGHMTTSHVERKSVRAQRRSVTMMMLVDCLILVVRATGVLLVVLMSSFCVICMRLHICSTECVFEMQLCVTA